MSSHRFAVSRRMRSATKSPRSDTAVQHFHRVLQGTAKKTLEDPTLIRAAVLLLLYPKDEQTHILLNKRSQEVEHHKGEIAFPGGVKDPRDSDMLATALREAWEEMGIHPQDVTVLGELDEVATRTHFAIHSFAATIPYPYPFRVSSREIDEVVELPLSVLQDLGNLRQEIHLLPDGRVVRRYTYGYNQHLIYGATAAILTRFLELMGSPSVEEALSR